jgi:Ca-activated chloride channel family protein
VTGAWHHHGVRRKWFAVALLLALGGWDPFRTTDEDVEAGNAAVAQGHYDEALKDYARARGRVDDGGLDYDVGTAKLKAADAAKDPAARDKLREEGLADLEKAAARAKDRDVRAQAAYNRGNALFAADKLDDAVHAYKDALKTNPDFEDARLNLELALRHRKKEQQQQQQNGQGQGQQGQGQNQQGQNQQGQGQGQQGQNQPGQGQQGQNPPGQQGQQPGQGSGSQAPQPGQGSGSNPSGQGSGSNQQNQQHPPGQGQGSQDPNQQAPKPKLPNGQTGSGSGGQEKTPDDSNLDQLEGESRDQRRNQARRRSDETYHPAETEDW